VKKLEGLFVYASLMAGDIQSRRGSFNAKMLEQLPIGIDRLYEKELERIKIIDNDECLEWRIMQLVVASESTHVHLDIVKELLECKSRPRVVAEAFEHLSRFFPIDENKKIRSYHKSLTDWLTDTDRRQEIFCGSAKAAGVYCRPLHGHF
jgi:hypothetical protein